MKKGILAILIFVSFFAYAGYRSYNLTADGSTNSSKLLCLKNTVTIDGDFGGGTATIEHSPNGSNWLDLLAVTTDTTVIVEACGFIRVTLASSTSPDLDIYIDNE